MTIFRLNEDTAATATQIQSKENAEALTTGQEPNAEAPGTIKEIILKAPLGHAYTEALNLLLDKKTNKNRDIRQESVYQALHANVLADEAEGDPNTPDHNKAFVYVYDGKKMNMGDLAHLYDDVAEKTEKVPEAGYVCVVIDNSQDLLDQPSMAKPFEQTMLALESMKVKFFFGTNGGINGITQFLKS